MNKNISSQIIIFCCQIFLVATLAIACQTTTPDTVPTLNSACIKNYNPSTDYFTSKATIKYATGFTVEYHNNYKTVTVKNPWKEAKQGFQYVLVQCGTPTPQGFAANQIINVPVNSIVTLSTTHLPHLAKLGVVDKLIGVSDRKTINTQEVVERIKTGQVAEVGSDANLNIEQVLALNPDLITTYSTGNQQLDTYPKLQEAGLKVAINAEYMENSPLGRSEWLKFTALFFNQEQTAEKIFTEIANRYEKTTQLAKSVTKPPTVFVGHNFKGTWYVPGGESYTAKYLQDAGANYLWSNDKSSGTLPLSFEAVLERAAIADYWLNLNLSWKTKQDVQAADNRYSEFKAFKTGNLYNNNARLNPTEGNDYWEGGISNPDIILSDLIKIFHPQLLPNHELTYYRKLN